MICTICSHQKTAGVRTVQSPLIDRQYQLYFCTSCESYFFNIDEWKFDLEQYYNQEYHNLDENFSISRHWSRQVMRILKEVPEKKPTLDILDVGCASGIFLLHWEKHHHLFGVELNKQNAQMAQKKGITIYQNFIENVEFDRQFDVITCYNILEHIPNPGPVLKKLTQILKKGGILAIEVPTIECKLYKKLIKKGIHWHMFNPPSHLSYYSRKFLDEFMSRQGIHLQKRYFKANGPFGIYSNRSPQFPALREASYNSLNQYYFGDKKQESNSMFMILKRKTKSTLIYVMDEYSPLNKFPLYDHMYSFYKKIYD